MINDACAQAMPKLNASLTPRVLQECFDKLHNVLESSYGLKSSSKVTSTEALGMFIWMCASQQSVRQADNRFTRSLCTVSRKFDKVLACLCKLVADIIRPNDPEFRAVHKRL